MLELPMASPRCCGPSTGVQLGDTTLGSTRAWCPMCGKPEHALYSDTGSGVFMDRVCPRQGSVRTPVCRTGQWFMDRVWQPRPIRQGGVRVPAAKGCPLDCGPCANHAGRLRLPIFSITNNCNLACPICFTHNRRDAVYNKTADELEALLDVIEAESRDLDLLNLTGGEPTLHPEIFDILERCSRRSFRRVSMNSNGLIIGRDRAFAEKLGETGVQVILSLDTLDSGKSMRIHGRDIVEDKLAALAALEELNISTVLLPVWIPGVNDDELPALISEYLPKPFISAVTVQNMAYTGHHGSRFSPRVHSTVEDVEHALATEGFGASDFFAPGSCHALCYSTAYYIMDGGRRLPLTRLVDPGLLTAGTAESYLLRPSRELEAAFREGVDTLWASGAERDDLLLLRRFIARHEEDLANGGRAFHDMVKTVTIHAHMDEDTFDLARVSLCGDLVPDENGAMIPACSYNLLYRRKDPRFWVEE